MALMRPLSFNTTFKTIAVLFCGGFLLFGLAGKADAATNCVDTATTGVPQIECEALIALYNSTTGASWTTKTNWNTASAVSTWSGVTVSGGHVTSLAMISNNLVGTLPTEIGNLASLTYLELRNSSTLTGPIPSSIGNLVNLTALNFYADGLSGSIPPEINNLTHLTDIYLHLNQLTGTIPSLSNLTSLVTLYLSYNQLSGSIPSGLSNTIRTLDLRANYGLSGPIPSEIASIPLTTFGIEYNKFVFSDMEPDFSSYCSGNRPGFTYNPQGNVDTNRSLTFTAGGALTITPSVSANANDIYQWYKEGVLIPGATSRVYTKTAAETDSGVYSYRVTNSVITGVTLQSNGITVAIAPNPPTPDSIYYIVSSNNTWVRGRISDTKDIAQQYVTFGATGNNNFNFGSTYIINSLTPNSITHYLTGTSTASAPGDDATPINSANVGYYMADHGLNSPVVTSIGHNKDSSDIGSTWSDGVHQFVLASISGNALTFYSMPSGSPWSTQTSVAGTLTHVSGAAHTGDITVTSQTTAQQYPAVKNIVHHILVNGATEATSGDSGYADYVDMSEEFDVIDPSTINTTHNPFVWNDGSVWMHVKIVYRATAGSTIVHTTYQIVRPMNVGYFGFIQVANLAAPAYDHQYFYIPRTKPISIYDFKAVQLFDAAPASTLFFDTAYLEDLAKPPDRETILLKKTAEDNYDIGFAFGYSPYGDSAADKRNCIASGCWFIYTSQKSYPEMVSSIGVINDTTYDVYAYRQWMDPKQYDINKQAYWNNQNGHDLVYVDYHRQATNDVTALPSRFIGKAVKVVDSENIQTPAALIPGSGNLSLSTTGVNTYGYAVLELLPAPSDPTSPVFSAATSSSSLVANWAWGGSTGDTGYTLDISAPNDCTSFSNVVSGLATTTHSYVFNGLLPNKNYCFRVAATSDSLATSGYATSSAKYTLANQASAPTLGTVTTSTIPLSINTNSNPSGTTYAVYDSINSKYFTALGAETATPTFFTTSSWSGITRGLNASSHYTFQVLARNGDGINSATSTGASATTASAAVNLSKTTVSTVEGGATDSYTIVLNAQPTSTVDVIVSPDSNQTVSTSTIAFTAANWNVPVTVTVTAVNDHIAQGTHIGIITHTVTNSGVFNGVTVSSVTNTITDNDTAGVNLSKTTVYTYEGIANDTYTIVLNSQPTSTVQVTISPDSSSSVSPTTINFTSVNWNVPVTVTVTAVVRNQGGHIGTITHTASSLSMGYRNITVASVTNSITGITIGPGGGGGGGGGSGGQSSPLPSQTSGNVVVTPPPTETPPPQTQPTLQALDPSNLQSLLDNLSLPRDIEMEDLVLKQVRADAKEFKLVLNAEQEMTIRNFIVYGISPDTIKLGRGERRAVVRDYMETVHRADFVWSDIERLTTGLIPLVRNLALERQNVNKALPVFLDIFGHSPNFKVAKENLAWNTLMYRIRFPRDMAKESAGLKVYFGIYKHYPTTPFGWSVVRVLGYVK